MRLLFVHERFGALAGAEANLILTAGEFRQRGHAVGLAHGPGTGRDEAAWREIFDHRFSLEGAPGAAVVRAALEQFQPDVIFLHKLSDLAAAEALTAGGVPVVRMVHDHDLYCMRGYKYNYFTRHICTRPASPYCVFPCGASLGRRAGTRFGIKWVSYAAKRRELKCNRRFQRLVVATSYMRDELLRNGFAPERIELHAPVPRAGDTSFQSSFSDRNLLVYAGQIVRGKGVDVLLESLARVRVPFECVLLGDGSHRPHCEKLSRRLGLENRVRFAGFVPQRDIMNHYRECSAAVMSSLWPEPFGATGLEAMRCGLPVVAFDAGGIREWLIDGWNGCLVPWMNRERYAAQVEALLRDKTAARRMGGHGRQWADQRFNFGRYISGLEDLFGRVRAAQTAPLLS